MDTVTAGNPLAAKFPELVPALERITWAEVPFEEIPEGKGAIAVMGLSGDTKQIWDPENLQEVEAARAVYSTLTAKGYRAFRVTGKDGSQGEQMDRFDPAAGRMILVPPMQGG